MCCQFLTVILKSYSYFISDSPKVNWQKCNSEFLLIVWEHIWKIELGDSIIGVWKFITSKQITRTVRHLRLSSYIVNFFCKKKFVWNGCILRLRQSAFENVNSRTVQNMRSLKFLKTVSKKFSNISEISQDFSKIKKKKISKFLKKFSKIVTVVALIMKQKTLTL